MTVMEAALEKNGPTWIRRLAQTAVMGDRGFSQADVAREVGVSSELISKYFQGLHPSNKKGTNWEAVEAFEDRVELALEALSRANGTDLPASQVVVTGPVDETGLPDFEFRDPFVLDAITRELMHA